MYLHDLVRTITLEILKELQGRSEKLSFLVLAENTADTAAKVRTALGNNVILSFADDVAKPEHAPTRSIIPFLSCSGMADLAMGKASDPYLQTALALLLQGKSVEVLEFEYKAHSSTAPFALYDLYSSYEKTLISYGLKAYAPEPEETIRFRDTLVTEQAVAEAHKSGASTMLVAERAIITPLAHEAAKELNITILKQL